ncbi:MAG: type IV secretory system conjugative DNA transfer family protein [Bacillota bacterium]|nr:type IV secretory system conjugative DNA transfer family protein [Bacillota bacterium]
MNKHIAVYGASGSMKSRAFVRNMIFQAVARGECLVMTDPKAELYEDMSLYLEEKGYKVRVFNLVHPECSDRWNCLSMVHGDEILAQICVEIIFTNTGDEAGNGFWNRGETNLLKALILYVDLEKNPEDRNMGTVYEMILERTDQELESLFGILPKGHPAKKPFHIYRKSDAKVRSDMMAGLGTRLQVFQSQKICDITEADDFVFSRMGWEKCAYFVIMSDQDSTFRFLSSLFFSALFVELVRSADDKTEERALPLGANFILDEFTQIGKIPDFKMKISTVRSRNIRISVIFQSLAQLENRYPHNEWLEILGNCDSQIALGCNDPLTAKFLSDRSGLTTVEAINESRDLYAWRFSNFTPEYKETNSDQPRGLMNPNEVMGIPMDEALIILRTKNVFRVKKFDYTKHPESKRLKKRKAVAYIPEWRKSQGKTENVVKSVKNVVKNVPPKKEQQKKEPVEITKFELMSKEANENGD